MPRHTNDPDYEQGMQDAIISYKNGISKSIRAAANPHDVADTTLGAREVQPKTPVSTILAATDFQTPNNATEVEQLLQQLSVLELPTVQDKLCASCLKLLSSHSLQMPFFSMITRNFVMLTRL